MDQTSADFSTLSLHVALLISPCISWCPMLPSLFHSICSYPVQTGSDVGGLLHTNPQYHPAADIMYPVVSDASIATSFHLFLSRADWLRCWRLTPHQSTIAWHC